MKTQSLRAQDVEKKWYIVDAEGVVLGRLASQIALRLRGKHKANYTPHVDCGDNIIIINAEKVMITGDKKNQDMFYWHTGYPGGVRGKSKGEILEGRYPERVLMKAIERMLPKTKLGRQMLTNLRVYAGTDHPHEPQKPEVLDVAAMNAKNKRV